MRDGGAEGPGVVREMGDAEGRGGREQTHRDTEADRRNIPPGLGGGYEVELTADSVSAVLFTPITASAFWGPSLSSD